MHNATRPFRKRLFHPVVVCGCLCLAGSIAMTIAGAVTSAPRGKRPAPDTVMLDELQNLYKPVPFDHKSHAGMAMMWDGCTTCHHYKPDPASNADRSDGSDTQKPHTQVESKIIPACKNCHPISPEEGTIRMPSLKAAYHRQCLNCHRKWSSENQCVVCHEPTKAGQIIKHQPTKDDIIGRMHPPIMAEVVKVYQTRFTPAAGNHVTFRHQEHIQRFGLPCNQCHHRDNCSDCHHLKDEQAGPRKPVTPAASWNQSHGPCMGCHQNQPCSHCHYPDGHEPPPSFEHAMTGQLLDDDHNQLKCKQCHFPYGYHKPPYCGNADCHPKRPEIKFPDDRPGPVNKPVAPKPGITIAAVQHPRPGAADRARKKTPILYVRDDAAAQQIDPYPKATVTAAPPIGQNKSAGCIRSQCHEDRLDYKYVHGPVAARDCAACHLLTDEKKHQFTLLRNKRDLCTYCHQFDVDAMPVLHQPVKTGQCLGCHDPHGGHDRSLTREKSIQQMCRRCHWPVTKDKSVLHDPVAQGRCTSCHPPHASKYPQLLDRVGAALCMTCHTDFERSLDKVMFRHKALQKGCDKCHDVHGSNYPLALVAPLDRLCDQCHEDLVKKARAATYPHSVVFQDRACVTCHTPHGGDLAKLMVQKPIKTCLSCHDKPIKQGDKVLVVDMSALNNPKLHKHGPLREGSCSGCHQPHGGDLDHMLVKPYSFNLRQPFDINQYALCFECHDRQLVQASQTKTATKFRNGDMNLHSLHVTKDIRGRNCIACHNAHVSRNAQNVKSTVQYREWEFSMNFTATETGGRCAPGCHLPFAYDRDQPVPLKLEWPRLIDRTATSPADNQVLEPLKVTWQGIDRNGRTVRIPTVQGRGVIVFVPTDAGQLATLVRWLDAAEPDEHSADVVLVFQKAETTALLDKLGSPIADHWSVVVDAHGKLARLMEVRSFPLVVLTDEQGNVISRMTGNSPSTALKLRTDLQWLARQHSTRAKQPPDTHPTLVNDRQVGRDTWYLQSARRHVEQHHLSLAKAVLEKGLTVVPDSALLKTELADVLIQNGEAERALGLIEKLCKPDADNPALELLRCRALIVEERYDQALKRLNKLVKSHPDRQAYFLLGQVYQKQQQWQKATQAYRRAGQMNHPSDR